MGASILPITVHNGKVLLLFGKERDIDENPGWSDFGGGTDKGESFMQTAVREGSEEMTGFLGSSDDIIRLLKRFGTFNIDFNSDNGYGTYRCHIFPIEYDDYLPHYYNNNQRFLQKKLPASVIRDTKIFEKTQIKWFDINELAKRRSEFRGFYRNIIDLIVENKTELEKFAKKSIKNKKGLKTIHKRNKLHLTKSKTRSKRN
uniref:Nudix hydrolase domain-containing protein n=1 Tax=viral metagenome TaxID=1070528 RepID=A0A6C0I7Y4_9ZZZZ